MEEMRPAPNHVITWTIAGAIQVLFVKITSQSGQNEGIFLIHMQS
jgi:hypothetical protein